MPTASGLPKRRDDRIILHLDYDCFYASVFEAENPALRSLPLAVQQKQIIVTCNYEARRRGLHKLQLITEAKRICPDVVIIVGEQLDVFRNASKELYNFLRANFSWNDRVERLGFDEVWLDATDIIDYNFGLRNTNNLKHSYFQLSRTDPTLGFEFDATTLAGHSFPQNNVYYSPGSALEQRLLLASHFLLHVRHTLEDRKGYSATGGISTNKLLSKLVGNKNKPRGQTTLMPPYETNVINFIDAHDIGAIPYIGFKTAQKLRALVLERDPEFDKGLLYGGTLESVTVEQLRKRPELTVELLEQVLSGPGTPHGIGSKVWSLIHGVDDTAVTEARDIPHQISIEDSYIRLDTLEEVSKQLHVLCEHLITRMRTDLAERDDEPVNKDANGANEDEELQRLRWIGRPATLRLTTRPRQPLNADGTRVRSFKRISRSMPAPTFLFNLKDSVEAVTSRLVTEALMPLFRKLHPEKSGWNLSLVNVAVTDMTASAGAGRHSSGRDIGKMFKQQDSVFESFKVKQEEPHDEDSEAQHVEDIRPRQVPLTSEADLDFDDDEASDAGWLEASEQHEEMTGNVCSICAELIPVFALAAHERYHAMEA